MTVFALGPKMAKSAPACQKETPHCCDIKSPAEAIQHLHFATMQNQILPAFQNDTKHLFFNSFNKPCLNIISHDPESKTPYEVTVVPNHSYCR